MYPNMPNGIQNSYGQYPYNSNQYNRLAQMEQQFASQQQTNPYIFGTPSQTQTMLKGRPVVSVEEARAAQIDLDGSMHIFTDIGNKKIYTKQINLDGTATLNTYALLEDEDKKSPKKTFVTRDELEIALAQMRQELLERNQVNAEQQHQSYATPPRSNGAATTPITKSNAGANVTVREQPTF